MTITFVILAALPSFTHGGFGEVGLALEPSITSLAIPLESKTYGYGYGISADLGLLRQLSVTVFARNDRFPRRNPAVGASSRGGTLRYLIDIGEVEPYVELGLARVALSVERRTAPPPETHPILGLGLQGVVSKRLLWGVVMRYYPLFDTDLLGAPAYASLQGRIGVAFGSDD